MSETDKIWRIIFVIFVVIAATNFLVVYGRVDHNTRLDNLEATTEALMDLSESLVRADSMSVVIDEKIIDHIQLRGLEAPQTGGE